MWRLTTVLAAAAVLIGAPASDAGDAATPEEVIAKVREAANYLAKEGKSGVAKFDKADTPFVWKDTYVFVFDCAGGIADIAHPVASSRNRKIANDKDAAGNVVGPELCKAAERPGGGWVEYMWWKPVKPEDGKGVTYEKKASRKVSYMLSVKGQPYQVGAGVYNDQLTVAELDALLTKK
jgi:signal transduction histidine kinase